MDVLSVDLCVQAVIAAYRDATRLVQRLRERQTQCEGSSLPQMLTKELEDSLALGSVILQSQYDHDVRRFGETYNRGDAIAREQIKDVVITLQKEVISHLHEVFMEEIDLDLTLLKETSEDSRVNATVCLGQLYQRMSTAEAFRKENYRHDLEQSDSGSVTSMPCSKSQRTQSSGDGAQSTTSYATHTSRPRFDHHRALSEGPSSYEAAKMPSQTLPGRMCHAGICVANENVVPALPYLMETPERNGGYKGPSRGGCDLQEVDQFHGRRDIDTIVSAPLDVSANVKGHDCQLQSAHNAEATANPPRNARRQDVPLNPDYSTLELVETLVVKKQLSQGSLASWQLHDTYVQQKSLQTPCSQARDPWQQLLRRGVPSASVLTAACHSPRAPKTSSITRRWSIRSSNSEGSSPIGFSLRRALPPGIFDVGRKKASSIPRGLRSDLKFPSESDLAGFCRGAVRQQLGSKKQGFVLVQRKGASEKDWLFRCTKCSFAGPAAISYALPSGGRGAAKRQKTFDTRVRTSPGGIKFRWAFLAKSHVPNNNGRSDLSNSNDRYGCCFCYVEEARRKCLDQKELSSGVAPTFEGLHAFLAHLETHRSPKRNESLIWANEMNCIVGRVAGGCEEFDLKLPQWKNENVAELF